MLTREWPRPDVVWRCRFSQGPKVEPKRVGDLTPPRNLAAGQLIVARFRAASGREDIPLVRGTLLHIAVYEFVATQISFSL